MLVKFILEHDGVIDFLFINYLEKKFVFLENLQKSDSKYKEYINDGCIKINGCQLIRILFELDIMGNFEGRTNIKEV